MINPDKDDKRIVSHYIPLPIFQVLIGKSKCFIVEFNPDIDSEMDGHPEYYDIVVGGGQR